MDTQLILNEFSLQSPDAYLIEINPLSDTKFVLLYKDVKDPFYYTAIIGTIIEDNVTFGKIL